MGGGMRPSRNELNNYLRTSDIPEYQQGDARYRLLTPEVNSARQGPYPGKWLGASPQEVVPGQVPGLPGVTQGTPPGRTVVEQLLQGSDRRGAETARPPAPLPAAAPSAWGGTMRPLAIPKGTSLLEMKQMYGGVENDPVLAARREEYDRNLADYLRQVPAWQSREEYEGGLASLPGAGAEILGHIQQRAIENMPVPMRQEWEQKEATRTATSKKLTEAAATEAAYREFLKTATPDQVKAFHQDYQRTPDGWKPVRVTPLEKQIAAEAAAGQRATPEQKKVWEKDYELTPEGKWRKKVTAGDQVLATILANRPGVNGHGNNPFRGGAEESPPPAERETPPAGPVPGTTPGVSAPTAGQTYEGRTATNPQTGQKVVFRNGRWEPQ